jgi:hypothetical protein
MMLDVFYIGRVKVLLHGRVRCVSYEEKGIWVYLVTSAGAGAVYLAILLGRVASTPVADVPYAAAALVMAMAKVDYFWIANVIYLGFVLWAVAGSALKLVAYRRGL